MKTTKEFEWSAKYEGSVINPFDEITTKILDNNVHKINTKNKKYFHHLAISKKYFSIVTKNLKEYCNAKVSNEASKFFF